MSTKKDIDLLIYDSISGIISKEDEIILSDWINESAANKEHFIKTCAIWDISGSLVDTKQFNSVKGWKRFSNLVNPRFRVREISIRLGQIAAILLVGLMMGYFLLQLNLNHQANSYIVNQAPLGSQSKVILPDGSNVWINAGSSIKYRSDFNQKERRLLLSGEAYFDVETNKKKPFIVIASGVCVEATGTNFNVRAYTEEDFIEATLEEGIVSVNTLGAKNKDNIVLEPNQNLTVYKEQTLVDEKNPGNDPFRYTEVAPKIRRVEIKSDISVELYTSWKDGKLIINSEKLGQLAMKLERIYDVKFHFENELVQNYKYTGILEDVTLEQVISAIEIAAPVKHKIKGKDVYISYNPAYFKNRN